MRKTNERTYTLKEVQENLDQYLNSSADRLRVRLKDAWKRQITARQLTHAEVKI